MYYIIKSIKISKLSTIEIETDDRTLKRMDSFSLEVNDKNYRFGLHEIHIDDIECGEIVLYSEPSCSIAKEDIETLEGFIGLELKKIS